MNQQWFISLLFYKQKYTMNHINLVIVLLWHNINIECKM